MQRWLVSSFIFLLSQFVTAQNYSAYNINLLAHLTPNMGDQGFDGRRYSGCWGWYQPSKSREYAFCGTSNGTYVYDITTATNPQQKGFVQGTQGATYREIKTKGHHAYIITDDPTTMGLQIVDLQYLPDSMPLRYSGDAYFTKAHSAWVDQNHLYLASTTFSNGFSPMTVWNLTNPTNPVLLRKLEQDFPFINLVHDMHVRNDTIYASCANQGFYIFKYDSINNKFLQLTSYSGYAGAGYNHSSALTADGKTLVFCEEIPAALPIQVLDLSNIGNMTPLRKFLPHPRTTPHNPCIRNQFAIISCYEDGLFIYDLTNPSNPSLAGYFDTYPQGGDNTGVYGTINYRGNWGNYPYLPSGKIIASDMQNGIFILDATSAYTTTVKDYVGITSTEPQIELQLEQRGNQIFISSPANNLGNLTITDIKGQQLKHLSIVGNQAVDCSGLPPGLYFCVLQSAGTSIQKKIILQH